MLRYLFDTIRGENSHRPSGSVERQVAEGNSHKATIDELYRLSRKGLWSIFIFLAASAIALHFRELTLNGAVPAGMMEQIGPTPPVLLVNVVLGVSTICSLIAIAGKLYGGRMPGNTWIHLSFRLFFYLLYFISNSLNEYFYVVFISGLVVLAFQHYNVWNYCGRAIELNMIPHLPADKSFQRR